jgi:hypothetical protein
MAAMSSLGRPTLTLGELELVIRAAWSRDTSEDPDEWSAENPARGQCAVTALVVRDLLGGDILIATVLPASGQPQERHAWNRLPSGLAVDLTGDQFRAGERLGPPEFREPRSDPADRERYERLSARVRGTPPRADSQGGRAL